MHYKRKKKWNKKYRYLRGGWNKEGKQKKFDDLYKEYRRLRFTFSRS